MKLSIIVIALVQNGLSCPSLTAVVHLLKPFWNNRVSYYFRSNVSLAAHVCQLNDATLAKTQFEVKMKQRVTALEQNFIAQSASNEETTSLL